MTDAPPITFFWTGDEFVPTTKQASRKCDEHYVVGERYQLVEHHERSQRSHNHFFAELTEVFDNLPEDQTDRFASPDHLRRWALIQTGYRDERSIVCASKAEAKRVAAFIKPIDTYAVVIAREAVVLVLTAKSQSKKAMGAKVFQESKTAVLDLVSSLIGVDTETLSKAAESRAA